MPHPVLKDLTTEATLGDLPSHEITVSPNTRGSWVAAEFERRPDLPGVIVREPGGQILAMISRGWFFESLSRPFGSEIYLQRPLKMFLESAQPKPLTLPVGQRIAEAAVLALDRTTEHAYEPIIVLGKDGSAKLLDMHILLRAEAHLLGVAQAAMLQSEKLASVGQLAAGVAHEINNPLAFVTNNLAVLHRDSKSLAAAVALYRQCDEAIAKAHPELHAELSELHERVDLTYTTNNLLELTARSREGLSRIRAIVSDLRDFARLDLGQEADVDLKAAITSTANIIGGRAKAADVTIDLQLQSLPPLPGNPSKINQVIMNLLANAVDACPPRGKVTVRLGQVHEAASIEVEDTGKGIDPGIASRIFDPFFTTKPPGSGTGLGLTISYGIVRDHGGVIDFVSQPGQGTIFRVLLPFYRHDPEAAAKGSQPNTPPAHHTPMSA